MSLLKSELLDYYCFTFSNKSNRNVLRRQVVQNKLNWQGLLLIYLLKIEPKSYRCH